MKVFYSDHYVLPLPAGHRFPMQKYQLLRARIASEMPEVELGEPPSATDGQLALAHDPGYIQKVVGNALDASELREIGFPWSNAMVERSRRSAGATIAACRAALGEGVAASLAGGTHHASRAHGSGFCVFNDAAVASRLMQAECRSVDGRQLRVAIVDLDVHQGNGTAEILEGDPSIFTLSVHGENNYPFRKARSNLDIGLPDGTRDDEYLDALKSALAICITEFAPGLVLFLAGADVHEGDRLGRLKLTKTGIASRDKMVFAHAAQKGVPIVVVMAGGYGKIIEDTVDVHVRTIKLAFEAWRARQGCETAIGFPMDASERSR
jgi:acetoin utilization deacetylase AcuC-like enzyme